MNTIKPGTIRIDEKTSRHDFLNALRDPAMKGVLRAERKHENGQTVFFLRRETLGERFLAALGIPSTQQASAQKEVKDALTHFASWNKSDRHASFDKLLHPAVIHIKAEQVQKSLMDPFGASAGNVGKVSSKVLAAFTDTPVSLALAHPMDVRADSAILRSGTLLAAASADPKFTALGTLVEKKMAPIQQGRAAMIDPHGAGELFKFTNQKLVTKAVTCMADLAIPDTGYGHSFISDQDLAAMYRSALQGKSGTVVIEPFPASLSGYAASGQLKRTSNDRQLLVLLNTVRAVTREAEANNESLCVTIATEDRELHARISALAKKQAPHAPIVKAPAVEDDGTGVFPR